MFFPLIGLKGLSSLIIQFAWKDIKVKYRGSYLGLIWTALEPTLLFLFLFFLFSSIRIRTQEDFAVYLLIGIILYHTFSRATLRGLVSLRDNNAILSTMNIRREFFPVVSTTTSAMLMIVEIGVFFALLPVFQFIPTWTVLLLPVVFGLLLVLILGMSYLLSIIYTRVRDIQPTWAVLVHALFFLTPIFWYLEDASGPILQLHQINPIGLIVELGHKLVFNEIPSWQEWAYVTVMVFGILFIGYGIFQKYQKNAMEQM